MYFSCWVACGVSVFCLKQRLRTNKLGLKSALSGGSVIRKSVVPHNRRQRKSSAGETKKGIATPTHGPSRQAGTRDMFGGRCAMRASSLTRNVKAPLPTALRHLCCRELSSSNLSPRQRMEGFTIKDHRPSRPRMAKEKRKQYLAQRKASFEAEHEKASSLGLGWGIRSAV